MVTVQVVLKGVYSTPRQTNSFYLNDFKNGVNDNVPGFTNPAKFGLDRINGGAPTWWWNIQVLWLLFFFLLYSRDAPRRNRWTDFDAQYVQKRAGVWRKDVPFVGEKYNYWKFGGVLPQKHPKNGSE